MAFVLDTSMTMAWCFVDESTESSRSVLQMLATTHAEVPSLWLFEVTNVLATSERRKRITAAVAEEFLKKLSLLDIRVEESAASSSGTELLALARVHGLTAYDAAYLGMATRTKLPLATFDKDLIRAAQREGVVLVGER